ncbi:hypothetical protein BH11CYA1_BH11CYA1_37070 [soil metagenome]
MPKLSSLSLLAVLTIIIVTACNQAEVTKEADGSQMSKQSQANQAACLKLTEQAKAAMSAGDKATAEAKFKEAIEAAKGVSADSPEQAAAIANLADFYYAQGDGAQANLLFTQSLSMHEKALGLMHVDLVTDLVGLAHVYSSEKKYAEAKASLERAVDILKKAGKDVPADITADLAKVEALAAK